MKTLITDSPLKEEQRVTHSLKAGYPTTLRGFRADYDHIKVLMDLSWELQFNIVYKTWEQTNLNLMNYVVREYYWNLYVLVRDGHMKLIKRDYEQTIAQA